MGFEKMEPIFGELKAECPGLPETTVNLRPFLFLLRSLPNEPSTLSFQVTNFHSDTWEALKTRSQLEDMRDGIGIGGSWSDFVEYFIASIKSEDIKLVIDGQSISGGSTYAKLIAQKGKGMPRIIISLTKLVDAAANEAMSNLSMELYKAYKKAHNSQINVSLFQAILTGIQLRFYLQFLLFSSEEKHRSKLTNLVSAEQEKNETLRRQLDTILYSKKQKVQRINDSETSKDSPDKQAVQNSPSTKAGKRVVPAYRRVKVRGVLLQDTEDDPQD